MKLFLILLPLLLISFSSHLPASESVDGQVIQRVSDVWSPIQNTTDPHVYEVGNYAVVEHNRQSGDSLEFLRVVSGDIQLGDLVFVWLVSGREVAVAPVTYRLVIEATDAEGNVARYRAVVTEREWEVRPLSLTSFVKA